MAQSTCPIPWRLLGEYADELEAAGLHSSFAGYPSHVIVYDKAKNRMRHTVSHFTSDSICILRLIGSVKALHDPRAFHFCIKQALKFRKLVKRGEHAYLSKHRVPDDNQLVCDFYTKQAAWGERLMGINAAVPAKVAEFPISFAVVGAASCAHCPLLP